MRVSAFNERGHSDAISSSPLREVTKDNQQYLLTNITLSTSKSDLPNRLYVEWALPTYDKFGFDTDSDLCGTAIGHTPLPVTSYVIEWDTDPSMKSSEQYIARMIEGDDSPLSCCSKSKCSVEIGTEIQNIQLYVILGYSM